MIIIGCDFHTRSLQIAMANDETGELLLERRLDHQSGEAHEFYRRVAQPSHASKTRVPSVLCLQPSWLAEFSQPQCSIAVHPRRKELAP